MSWDIDIVFDECPHCGMSHPDVEVRNFTYNNSAIMSQLEVHPRILHKMQTADTIPKLLRALELLNNPAIIEQLTPLEPDNGWGGIDDCRNFITLLLQKCQEFPKGVIYVS